MSLQPDGEGLAGSRATKDPDKWVNVMRRADRRRAARVRTESTLPRPVPRCTTEWSSVFWRGGCPAVVVARCKIACIKLIYLCASWAPQAAALRLSARGALYWHC